MESQNVLDALLFLVHTLPDFHCVLSVVDVYILVVVFLTRYKLKTSGTEGKTVARESETCFKMAEIGSAIKYVIT